MFCCYEWHVDRKCDQVRSSHRGHRFRQPAQRATGRRIVHEGLNFIREPGRTRPCGNEDRFRSERAKNIQLSFPQRAPLELDGRLVPAHPPGFTTSEENGRESHQGELRRVLVSCEYLAVPAVDPKQNGIGPGSILRRTAAGGHECVTDEVAIEEPLEIRIGGEPVATTMRTPGHDTELAAGFLVSEAILRSRSDLGAISASAANVINLELGPGTKFERSSVQRFGTISASCGLCGKTSIDFIRQQFGLIPSVSSQIMESVFLELPEKLRAAQGNFARTGGIHAAGIFDFAGNALVVREDIGRHNAVDKAIGRAFLDGLLPLREHVLVVSGRTSLEIVQKALAASIPIVAAVSAPSSLAINFARESGQTLVGFLRPPTFNIYSHIERIAFEG